MGEAFGGRDESRPHLNSRVSEVDHGAKGPRIADAARADHRQPKVSDLVKQGFWGPWARVSAGDVVDRDQPMDTRIDGLEGPAALVDVVIYEPADLIHAVHDPTRLTE